MAKELKYLFFDTELSGYTHLVSLGYVLTNGEGEPLQTEYNLVKPYKPIKKSTVAIHGITTEEARKEGLSLSPLLTKFTAASKQANVICCYAAYGDLVSMSLAYQHLKRSNPFEAGNAIIIDVAYMAEKYMRDRELIQPGQTPGLDHVYATLFPGEEYHRHNSLADAEATAKCFWKLLDEGCLRCKAILPHARIKEICGRDKTRKKKKEKEKKDKKEKGKEENKK